MTVRETDHMVTRECFEGKWDALWRGSYTDRAEGRFEIEIERLGKGPQVTVELTDRDIKALRDAFGPGFDEEAGTSVILGDALKMGDELAKGRYEYSDMVATRASAWVPIVLQAIGKDVRLAISDADWTACRERLGIGRALDGESEEGE